MYRPAPRPQSIDTRIPEPWTCPFSIRWNDLSTDETVERTYGKDVLLKLSGAGAIASLCSALQCAEGFKPRAARAESRSPGRRSLCRRFLSSAGRREIRRAALCLRGTAQPERHSARSRAAPPLG